MESESEHWVWWPEKIQHLLLMFWIVAKCSPVKFHCNCAGNISVYHHFNVWPLNRRNKKHTSELIQEQQQNWPRNATLPLPVKCFGVVFLNNGFWLVLWHRNLQNYIFLAEKYDNSKKENCSPDSEFLSFYHKTLINVVLFIDSTAANIRNIQLTQNMAISSLSSCPASLKRENPWTTTKKSTQWSVK